MRRDGRGIEVGGVVICPGCGYVCPSDSSFCPKCGSELAAVCPGCGLEHAPEFAYCPKCGTALTAEPEPDQVTERLKRLIPQEFAERLQAPGRDVAGERRVVTILFCDVTGSTAMAETLDPEDVMEIMDGAFDVMIEPIVRYEGTVARLMGDAVLAFFGAPIAHEDDPERACRAALEIVEGARAYSETLERARGVEGFDVRVGINTGLVVVGEVGSDLRVEYTAMGDAINVAARMEGEAEPGTVLVAEETYRLIAPLFETEALGPVEVKGKEEPLSTYRVVAAKVTQHKVRGIAGLDSPLVGREAELSALEESLEQLESGVGGIVTIMGEAGIGKSRLVAEVRKRNLAKVHGRTGSAGRLEWVEGRCLSYGGSIAYLLWIDALRHLLHVTPGDAPARVRDVLEKTVTRLCPEAIDEVYPYLARLMSLPLEEETQVALEGLSGDELKARTFGALETMLAGAADEHPLVVVCEDLHWADPTSTEVLEQLLPLTDHASLLLVGVFRPDKEHGSWRLREKVAREYGYRHTDLRLERLSSGESETLVRNLLRLGALPQDLRARILNQAEGNPFYVEEIIRSLIDQGAIAPDEARGRWEATQEVDAIPIPDTLHGVLVARIDRLEEETKRVLRMASVIGRIFLYRILASIAEEERRLDERLLTLQREELIRERARLPELAYIFKHELTREAAYSGLLKKERRAFHRQVAEALERLFPERVEEQAALLAHHWERAGHAQKAVPYLLRAGDQARMVYAHEEATDFYHRAMDFLGDPGERRTAAQTLMKLGLVHTAAFQPERAQQAYEEAFRLLEHERAIDDIRAVAEAHGVLRLAVEQPLTFDPGRASDDVSRFMVSQLFQALVEVDEDYNVLPAVAGRWSAIDDGRTYLFHLRENVRWSDGKLLTASDFERAWKRNLDPETGSPVAHLLYPIENARAFAEGRIRDPRRVGVKALSDETLEVRLRGPTAYFLYLMAHPVACPLPGEAVVVGGGSWSEPETLVGNGAYRVAAWEQGERLTLERNAHYPGPFAGNVERVECQIFRDFSPVLEAYTCDDLDMVSMITSGPGTVERARAAHGKDLQFIPQHSTVYVAFLTDRVPLDDVRVRKALVHAVDRRRLVEAAWKGVYRAPCGGFVPPGMPGHSSDIALGYDPDVAQRLLAEAGYAAGKGFPPIRLIYLRGSGPEPVIPFLQRAWADILGVLVEVESVSWEVLVERRGPANMILCGWSADYLDPDHMLRAAFHSREGDNMPGWESSRFDALVERAVRVPDPARRMELYRQADQILVTEEAVVMPLGYARGRVLAKPWVTVPRLPPAVLRLRDVVRGPPRAYGAGD